MYRNMEPPESNPMQSLLPLQQSSPIATDIAALRKHHHAPCPTTDSQLINNILVVIRTGATEIHDKLPIHFDTTLRCVPSLVIYSDYSETIAGHAVHDVFRGVNKSLIATEPDFAHYRYLQSQGRQGLNTTAHFGSGPTGSENPAWKLDRFKFLPMLDEALQYRDNATWYVFIEADTYMLWPNLVGYLAGYNASEAIYIGRQMMIGDVVFGHGGSGFMLTNAAMRKVTQHRNAYLQEYDEFTVREWAGDMVLAKVLVDAGIGLTWGWPHLEGNSISFLDFNDTQNGRTPWCYAPVTYHHMRGPDIEEFYAFEQDWRKKSGTALLLYKDVFREFVMPKLAKEVEGWDNLSKETEPVEDPVETRSVEECLAVCKAEPGCLQYSYGSGNCSIATRARHGQDPKEGEESIRSGWMMDRIVQYADEKDSTCPGGPDDMWVVY
ncbi:glycosyltransferase family 31 protein [Plenodomus tracheiphilus IPT5]|uniref:N-acetylgalactosaminide beta-1,3-galactosyltransferase n=1 Tax=Plenodomus tracheiphilus IPT5 TaxID=1408161 RepID=A0A6A7BIF6_9PLEO|nr:glycosyltransferase family 31 protein [Plenodomus tracheiphilus IPT5]